MGASKVMHTVIEKDCNGCGLCIEPCPVDCIDLITLGEQSKTEKQEAQSRNLARFHAREKRLVRKKQEKKHRHLKAKKHKESAKHTKDARRSAIEAALARTLNKKT